MKYLLPHKNQLLTKIVSYVFIFAMLASALIIGLQVSLTYYKEKSQILETLDNFGSSQLDTLLNSVWNFDQTAIDIQLNSLCEHPDISLIRLKSYSNEVYTYCQKQYKPDKLIEKSFPLIRTEDEKRHQLGHIEILATTEHINDKLLLNASKAFVSQLLILFLTCGFILVLFLVLFNSHINRIVNYTEAMELGQLDRPLALLRRKKTSEQNDELDRIVNAINTMRKRLMLEIKAQQLAEKKLFEEKQFSDTIINSLPGILFVVNEDMKTVRYNNTYKDKIGVHTEDIENFNIFNRIADEHRPLATTTLSKLFAENTSAVLEIQLLSRSSNKIPYLVTITPLTVEGTKYLIGIGMDLTDQKKIESQLRQAQKMEAIGTLAGGVAHDFNNILSALSGYTQLALLESKDNAKVQKYLTEVTKASIRAKDLVSQILTISRKTESEKHPLQVRLVVSEALKLLRSSIPTTIEIVTNIVSQRAIIADATEIHQVVMNLCTNAYQAMQKTGGTLSVSLLDREIHSDEFHPDLAIPPGSYLHLEISDTGIGMDEATQAKIFEPYFTTKKSGTGTGLGLAVVHGIVTNNNGYIRVYSQPGQGTTFNIYFPTIINTGKPETAPSSRTISALKGGTETILLIDDEEDVLYFHGELLRKVGYTVEECKSSPEGLALFHEEPDRYDLIITDLTMPGMTGEQLGREIFATHPEQPVVIVSGFSGNMNRNLFINKGFADFIQKPIEIEPFLSRIRQILDAGHPPNFNSSTS